MEGSLIGRLLSGSVGLYYNMPLPFQPPEKKMSLPCCFAAVSPEHQPQTVVSAAGDGGAAGRMRTSDMSDLPTSLMLLC